MLALLPSRSTTDDMLSKRISLGIPPVALNDAIRQSNTWGSGQGGELLRYALGKLKKNGFKNICLWVMKGNIRARKFYEKNGFQISGNEREIEIAECRVSEVEYIYYG